MIYIPKLMTRSKLESKLDERLLEPCHSISLHYLVQCKVCGESAMTHTDEYCEEHDHQYESEGCGIHVRLMSARGDSNVYLPQDGEILYIMNEQGHTIQTYRWPPPTRAEGEAVMRTGQEDVAQVVGGAR